MNSPRVVFNSKNTTNVILQDKSFEKLSIENRVIAILREIFDPELPVNIYDLGLIYNININSNAEVSIQMTLTAPGCPVAGSLPILVEKSIKNIKGIKDANVELVWDPPWSEDNMSDEAKLTLGLF